MRIPRSGELYIHFKNKLYQIITIATHSETGEPLVVYQALYGDYSIYARPLDMFISPVDKEKYPEVKQTYRFELYQPKAEIESNEEEHGVEISCTNHDKDMESFAKPIEDGSSPLSNKDQNLSKGVFIKRDNPHYKQKDGEVSQLLLDFLDESSMGKRLELITSNQEYIDDRVINNMAVALDCAVGDGPIEQRIQELIACLKAMSRFEDKRIR